MQTPQKIVPQDLFTPEEATEMLQYLANNSVTKDHLDASFVDFGKIIDSKLGKFSQDIKDHTTRECAKVRGDLVAIAHRQDEKTNEFVRTAAKSGTISRADAGRLQGINPFFVPTDQPAL